jgi:hypothetical protein
MELRGFDVNLYETALRKSGGALGLVCNLTPYTQHLKWDIFAQGWFGTATIALTAPGDVLQWLYDVALEYHVEIADAELITRYEGFVSRLTLTLGGVRKSKTLEDMWNEVRVAYGDHQVAVARSTTSKTQWGERRSVQSVARNSRSAAQSFADLFLSEHKDPHGDINSELTGDIDEGGTRLEITCQGYWNTLAWTNTKSRKRRLDTGKQIRRILQGFEAGAVANHGFLSTDYSLIPTTGLSRAHEAKDIPTAQARILRIMRQGDASGVKLMGGVGRERTFFLFSRPTSLDYFYDPYETEYRDIGGAVIPKWQVEPGRFVYLQSPYPAQQPTDDPMNNPNYCQFINRVEYDPLNNSIVLENLDGVSILQTLGKIH